jgi:hypothetical protein
MKLRVYATVAKTNALIYEAEVEYSPPVVLSWAMGNVSK